MDSSFPLESLIDVGCGRGIVGALVRIYRNVTRLVGVDIFPPYIDFCKKFNLYDKIYPMDLRQTPLPFKNHEFEVATCIEVVEHLHKEYGEKLLDELQRIADTIIVSTPSHYFKQPKHHVDRNPFQTHVSKWAISDFRKRGYEVIGVGNLTIINLNIPIRKLTCKFPQLYQFLLAKRK